MEDVGLYLADTSAWLRAGLAAVAEAWAARLAENSLATCAPVRLEVLYTARSARDYDLLAARLGAVFQLPCGDHQFDRALEVQRDLAHRAGLHHRSVRIPDLLIAASAEAAGATVWHYDEDFERIAEITGQPHEWVAPRASL